MIDEKEQLSAPMEFTTDRACTDNEKIMVFYWHRMDVRQGENLENNFNKVYKLSVEENRVTVTASAAGVSRAPYFRYFGNGPMESYCDMTHHGTIDWHASYADNEYVPYVRPQEHGNHTHTKQLEIAGGLKFIADTQMN